jgi:hypothetical protein
MDAVFALQRSGSDAVFAYQFPVAATQATAGWGHLPIPEPFRERERAVPKVVQDLEDAAQAERAAEIAAATVARARATEPGAVAPLETPVPESLARLTPPLDATTLLVQIQTTSAPIVGLPAAALDEDAILSAAMLLMRRRLTR